MSRQIIQTLTVAKNKTMQVSFLTTLKLEVFGEKHYKLLDKLWVRVYIESDSNVRYFEVPKGFETDLASVPRIPFAYWLAGGVGHEAAVIHDYLYRVADVKRKYADDVFLAGLKELKVNWFTRRLMYTAVRLFGSKNNG